MAFERCFKVENNAKIIALGSLSYCEQKYEDAKKRSSKENDVIRLIAPSGNILKEW